MPVKVSYAYCEWSDREHIRKKIENYNKESIKSNKKDEVNQNGRNAN